MTKSQIAILIVLSLAVLSVLGVLTVIAIRPAELFPVPTVTLEPTLAPSFTPSPTLTKIVLPATWTPPPTAIPSVTPTHLPHTTTPTSNIPTLPPGAVQVSGAGDSQSYVFGLPEGQVTVKWVYRGAPGDGSYTNPVPSTCGWEYDTENSRYEYWKSIYRLRLDEAATNGDAHSGIYYQNMLTIETNRHNQMIASIDNRCKQVTTTKSSPITASLCHTTTNTCQVILSFTGANQGSYKLATKKGTDYYLSVKTPGAWEIALVP